MRTPIALQGVLLAPDGSPSTGQVCAVPTVATMNGNIAYPATPLCGVIDGLGRLVSNGYAAFDIFATDDEGTTPADSAYTFTLQLDGQDVAEFSAVVPVSSTATDSAPTYADAATVITLGDLIASVAMVNQEVTGADIPDDTVVTAFDTLANTVTISNPTTGATGSPVTIGGCVSLLALEADAS